MNKIEFVGLTKNNAIRRALDYWYKKMSSSQTLKEFLTKCTWEKTDIGFTIIYRKNIK
jgi:hypothetical protein